MIIIIKIIKIIILFLEFLGFLIAFRNWKSRFLDNGQDGLELLFIDVVLIVAFNQMRNVGHSRFDIFWHDSNGLQMIKLRKLEKLGFFFISILFMNKVKIGRVFFLDLTIIFFFLLCWLNKSHLSGNGEMSNRAMNDSLVEFVFENIFFYWKILFKIIDWKFVHVHDGANVELVNPMNHFINA